MSQTKWLFPFLVTCALVSSAQADPQRPLFSLENRFPRWEQLETGASYDAASFESDFGDTDVWAFTPYARYGILDNLAVRLDVPILGYDSDFSGSEYGLGDLLVEVQLRTYEDIFGYPYFIPHVSASIPTGDEDKGLGVDGSVVTAGMSYGGRIRDWIGWVLDAGYRINPDLDNQLLLSHSYMWDVSEAFTLLTEVRYEEETSEDDDSLVLMTGGFSYDWTGKLQMGVHAGASLTGEPSAIGQLRLSYSF